MKKSGLLLLLPLMLIFLMSFVAATWTNDALNFLGFATPSTELTVVTVIVFIILALAFGDILSGFTAFSPWVSWMIGFGLAIIGSLTGVVKIMAIGLMQVGAGLGVISVFIAIGTAFLAFALLHIGPIHWLKKWFTWAKQRQEAIHAHRGGERVGRGVVELASIEEQLAKAGR